jgi:hypothetical protein
MTSGAVAHSFAFYGLLWLRFVAPLSYCKQPARPSMMTSSSLVSHSVSAARLHKACRLMLIGVNSLGRASLRQRQQAQEAGGQA